MVLSIEEHVFLIEYVFWEDNRYTDLVQEQFAEKFPETTVPHRNAVRRLTEKFHETGSVLYTEWSGRPSKFNVKKLMNISDSLLQFGAREARNTFYKCTVTFWTHCSWTCITLILYLRKILDVAMVIHKVRICNYV
jgi:hypothetical protein